MGNPIYRPREIHVGMTKITFPPWTDIAQQIRDMSIYLRQWWGEGQVYTYSGPGRSLPNEHVSPDFDYTEIYGEPVEFAVILHSPPKDDTTNPDRSLSGALLPWRVVPKIQIDWNFNLGFAEIPATVKWRHLSHGLTADRCIYRSAETWPQNWDQIDGSSPASKLGEVQLGFYQSGNLFDDGNMERTTALYKFWVAADDVLEKDDINYHSGLQSLKVTSDNGYVSGPWINGVTKPMVIGSDYRIAGWFRGDGTANPSVVCGAATLATGTSSTDWQQFIAAFTAAGDVVELTCNGVGSVNFDDLNIGEVGIMDYTPDSGGDFTVGFLTVDRIRVAALSLWTTPDTPTITSEEEIVTQGQLAEGRAIRGYTGTGVPSVGNLERAMGTGSLDEDDVERATRRCLLQSGHPRGLKTTESAAYYNIRGGHDSYFAVFPRNLLGKATGSNVSTVPCLYGYCVGAGVGTEAYVRMTALVSGDTWEFAIDSDTEALWTDAERLLVDVAGDFVKIEVKAPTDGYIVIRAYSIWEDAYDL